MNEELLRQALQSGQINLSQYKEAVIDLAMNSTDISQDMKEALARRYGMQQGLLGGQQMQQSPATGYPVQADTGWQPPTMPPQRPVDPLIGQQMPQVGNRGLDTPAERDYLEQFVENYNKNGVMSRGVDTPNERDFLQNIMQDYNKNGVIR